MHSPAAPAPPRPLAFQSIPDALKKRDRWILWRFESDADGNWLKRAYRPSGGFAEPNDSRTWSKFSHVQEAFDRQRRYKAPYDGIAFALGDNFTAIELEGIFPNETPNTKHETQDPKHGSPYDWAVDLVAQFATYTEVSPDGLGLSILVHGTFEGRNIEPVEHPAGGAIALSRQNRFIAITGHRWPEGSRQNLQHRHTQLQNLAAQLRPASQTSGAAEPKNTVSSSSDAAEHRNTLSQVSGPAEQDTTAPMTEAQEHEAQSAMGSAGYQTPNTQTPNTQTPNTQTLPDFDPAQRIEELENRVANLLCVLRSRDLAAEAASAATAYDTAVAALADLDALGVPDDLDPNLADKIVELALDEFRLGRTPADETFAVSIHGPNIAHMLRGGSAPLRKALAREFRRCHGRTLNSSALTDALTIIEAEAADLEPEEGALRVASVHCAVPVGNAVPGVPSSEEQEQAQRNASASAAADETLNTPALSTVEGKHETLSRDPTTSNTEAIVIDLGRPDGQTVIVTASGWRILLRSPVLFRRTPLTAQLPLPVTGGRLDQLRELINVGDEGFQMLRGWLVAALFPSIGHPILALRGEQGTGKSTALRMLAGLVDPSAALALSAPNDSESWVTMANGGWCLPLDNVAGISPWFSEALCRAVTGEGVVRRRLYTDGDFAVIAFRRVIALTTINLGPIAEDLSARMLPVDLELIDKSARVHETSLLARYEALKPQLFGALLDEVSATLRNLPSVHLKELPRMADFARLLAALPCSDVAAAVPSRPGLPCDPVGNALRGVPSATDPQTLNPEPRTLNSPLATYLRLIDQVAWEVAESDPVATAVSEFMSTRETWQGTATELLSLLRKPEDARGWPKIGQHLSARLKRMASPLRTMGIEFDRSRELGFERKRVIQLKSIPVESGID